MFPPQESPLTAKTKFVPRDGDIISGLFAKPIFESTAIFGNGEEGRERGAIFVSSQLVAAIDRSLIETAPADTTHVLMATIVGYTDRFDCLVVYGILLFCGIHYSARSDPEFSMRLSEKTFAQANGFPPSDVGAVCKVGVEDRETFVTHQSAPLPPASPFSIAEMSRAGESSLTRSSSAPAGRVTRYRPTHSRPSRCRASRTETAPPGPSIGSAGTSRSTPLRGPYSESSRDSSGGIRILLGLPPPTT